MKVELSLLRTRVARRMLLLFLLCALIPVVTLAVITYTSVQARLEESAMQQLRGDSKSAGMLILARFEALATMLQSAEVESDSSEARRAFAAVATETEDGALHPVRGRMDSLPSLNPEQTARLVAGRPVLVVSRHSGVPGVYVVVRKVGSVGSYPRAWGYLSVGSAFAGLGLSRDGIEVCVADHEGLLACSTARPGVRVAGQVLSTEWPMFLKSGFGAPAWKITMTEPRAEAFAPLAEFRRTFLFGIAFAVILVFILSHVQIRRRMTPLADLEAGTRRLREGDFSSRVSIQSDDEFQSLGNSFNQMATDIERQFTTLSALHDIDHAALQDHSVSAITAAALRGAPALLGTDIVAVAAAGADDNPAWRLDLMTRDGTAVRLDDVELTTLDRAALTSGTGHVRLAGESSWPAYCRAFEAYACRELTLFPIRGQRGPIGVLVIGQRTIAPLPQESLVTAKRLSEQLALGLSNVTLLEELDSLSLGALTALARTIDAASHWTAGHSERVTRYAVRIAEKLGCDEVEIVRLRQGSLLHDLGKIGVPPHILDKAGPLDPEELKIMQSHPTIGARIVESVRAFRELVPLVLYHHELLDGTGYPHGLMGEEIPYLARILTVADVFDALTSDRPYRQGLSADSALAILNQGIGTKFEARAVTAMHEVVADEWSTPTSAGVRDGQLSARDEQMFVGVIEEQIA